MILLSHVLSGGVGALAAVLWVSRMGSAQPATGKDWLITSFAVAIVGGDWAGGRAHLGAGLAVRGDYHRPHQERLGDAGGQCLLRTGVSGVDYSVGCGGEPSAGVVWGAERRVASRSQSVAKAETPIRSRYPLGKLSHRSCPLISKV